MPAPPVSCPPRWASATRAGQLHGRPSETNAHPHIDCEGKIAIVHNGIDENYVQLRDELKAEGHTFRSETDTEIVAHLLEKYYDGDLVAAMAKTVDATEALSRHRRHPRRPPRPDRCHPQGQPHRRRLRGRAAGVLGRFGHRRGHELHARRHLLEDGQGRQAYARASPATTETSPRSSPRSHTSIGMPRAPARRLPGFHAERDLRAAARRATPSPAPSRTAACFSTTT